MDTPSDSIPRHTSGAGVESDGGFPEFDSVSMVGVLTGFDPSRLDDDGLLRVMAGIQRVVAAAQSMQVKAMAGLSRRRPRTSGHPFGEFVADDIALELCMTRQAAEGRLGQAVEMTTHTPAVLRALETGALDLYRASAITDATYGLDEATAAQVATDVVGRVERRNVSEIRRIARRAVLRVAPEGAERRRERARADRKVVLSPVGRRDGRTDRVPTRRPSHRSLRAAFGYGPHNSLTKGIHHGRQPGSAVSRSPPHEAPSNLATHTGQRPPPLDQPNRPALHHRTSEIRPTINGRTLVTMMQIIQGRGGLQMPCADRTGHHPSRPPKPLPEKRHEDEAAPSHPPTTTT